MGIGIAIKFDNHDSLQIKPFWLTELVEKSQTSNNYQRAFTLIELLTVVFVVALIVTLVVVNIDRDDDRIALLEAKRFAALANHVQDESILQGAPMGISVDLLKNSYRILIRKENWQVIQEDNLLRPREIPESVKIDLEVFEEDQLDQPIESESDGLENLSNSSSEEEFLDPPQIIMDPYGITSNFTLSFFGRSQAFEVKPNINQEIVVGIR